MPLPFVADATSASFHIDGIAVTLDQVTRALGHRQSVRAFRSPTSHRLRVHAAMLRCCERMILQRRPLRGIQLYRWYAGLSAGLGVARGSPDQSRRFEDVVARVNFSTPSLSFAVGQSVTLYNELLAEPIVPSYNGILARLLLNLHLGRSGLLPVIIEPAGDEPAVQRLDEPTLLRLLLRRYELAGVA